MIGVLRFWLDRGVDGFRVDAVDRLIREPTLAHNPPEVAQARTGLGEHARLLRHIDQPGVHDVIRELRAALSDYEPEPLLLGEVGVADPERWAAYYGDGDELMLTLNFAFWSQPWSAAAFHDVIAATTRRVPDGAWPVWALGNHDITRLATRYDQDGRGPSRARLAAMMLLTLRGTPLLYYGDEIGMTNVAVPAGDAVDIDGRDAVRTPMQWSLPQRLLHHRVEAMAAGPGRPIRERQRDRPAGGPGFTLEPLPRPAHTATFDTCGF